MKYVFLFTFFVVQMVQAGYQWPIKPFNQQHDVSATFCENRPSSDGTNQIDHFHNAIDIPLAEGGEVFAIEGGNVEWIVRDGYTAYIRVGRYNYLHVTPLTSLEVNDYVQKGQLVGHTNYANHVHLIDGYYPDYINPLRPDGIAPFQDSYIPTVAWIKLYMDGTNTKFTNGKVSGLVDIVARLYDKTDNSTYGSNNGIYLAGYQIFDSSGTGPLSDAYTPYQFDVRPGNSYVTNVYFPGSGLSTYLYILTNHVTGNGYWNTTNFAPGTYKIKVFARDTRENNVTAWKTVQVARQDVWPPEPPRIKSFIAQPNGDWQLNWFANDSSDVAGYEFFYSFDGENFNKQQSISASIAAGDTNYAYSNFTVSDPFYVRLRAYDNAPVRNYSGFSTTYALQLAPAGTPFLIVNGFTRKDGIWKKNRHDFVATYADMLTRQGIPFNSCEASAIADGSVLLTDYPNVAFFNGDGSALNAAVRQAMETDLEQGGHLFLCGSDVASGLTLEGDSSFVRNYLKCSLSADSAETAVITDSVATLTAELSQPFGRLPATDVLTPAEGATSFFFYGDASTAGVRYEGMFGASAVAGKIVFAGFPLELTEPEVARKQLFSKALNVFGFSTTGISPVAVQHPQNFELEQNFPNPFNPQTEIHYTVAQPGASGDGVWVRLTVYNALGQAVKEMVRAKQKPGVYRVVFNSGHLPSGVYYYRLTAGTFSATRKMILLR